jgi:hypothetical protein
MPQPPRDRRAERSSPARLMVLLRKGTPLQYAEQVLGMSVVRASDYNHSPRIDDLPSSTAVLLDHTHVLLVADTPEISLRLHEAMQKPENQIIAVEHSHRLYGSEISDYDRGYREGICELLRRFETVVEPLRVRCLRKARESALESTRTFVEDQFTWGLQAVNAAPSGYTGMGVRVAVLDSGLDFNHPDFVGRPIAASSSFLSGLAVQDDNGHGTHCTGTISGPVAPSSGPRYGIAHDVDLYIGRVLDQNLVGDEWTLQLGINWAIANRCHIISISLGSQVQRGESYSNVFEGVAQSALAAGTLLIAAAGNHSARSAGIVEPVQSPADCPSILCVGSVDSGNAIADDSNPRINPNAAVDLVGPGVAITSSWRLPFTYRMKDGTSMATAHVSGVAALWCEKLNLSSGQALWDRLINSTAGLTLSAIDAGAGLVQGP